MNNNEVSPEVLRRISIPLQLDVFLFVKSRLLRIRPSRKHFGSSSRMLGFLYYNFTNSINRSFIVGIIIIFLYINNSSFNLFKFTKNPMYVFIIFPSALIGLGVAKTEAKQRRDCITQSKQAQQPSESRGSVVDLPSLGQSGLRTGEKSKPGHYSTKVIDRPSKQPTECGNVCVGGATATPHHQNPIKLTTTGRRSSNSYWIWEESE